MPEQNTQISSDGVKSASMVCAYCGYVGKNDEALCPNDGTALKVMSQHSLVGSVLSERYKILSLLGTGGMGSVYKAKQLLLDKIVAVKVLHGSVGSDEPERARRFRQEGKVISSLSHPNIVGALDFGVENGQAFLVMDYVDGSILYDVIMKCGHLEASRAVPIFTQICDAMQYAHSKGIIHRDLKPSNVMLVDEGDGKELVKLLDFGVAKLLKQDESAPALTKTGMVFGSPPYMSPEQCLGQQPDARSDIYSLGCVMYETLTGATPIGGQNSLEILHNQIGIMPVSFADVPRKLHVPASIESVVFKALAKKPEERCQSMAELKQDLLKASADPHFRAATADKPGETRRLKDTGSQLRKPVLIGGAVAAITVAVGFFFLSRGAINRQGDSTTVSATSIVASPSSASSAAFSKITPPEIQVLSNSAAALQQLSSGESLSQAQYAKIESTLSQAISYEEKTHGKNSPELVNYLAPLAQCLVRQGKMSEFEAVYARAAKIAHDSPSAPKVFEVRIQYVAELVQKGQLQSAKNHCHVLWQTMKHDHHASTTQMKEVLSLMQQSCGGDVKEINEESRFFKSEIAEATSKHKGTVVALLTHEANSLAERSGMNQMLVASATQREVLDERVPSTNRKHDSEIAQLAMLPQGSLAPGAGGGGEAGVGGDARGGGDQLAVDKLGDSRAAGNENMSLREKGSSNQPSPSLAGSTSGTIGPSSSSRASRLRSDSEPNIEDLQRAERLDVRGQAFVKKHMYADAERVFINALAIRQRLGKPTEGAALDLAQLGTAQLEQGKFKEALQSTNAALNMVRQVDSSDTALINELTARLDLIRARQKNQ